MAERADRERTGRIDPAVPLPRCPKVQSNVYWPAPIDHRLNQLVDLAVSVGEKLSRADLLGALVQNAPEDGESLGDLVRAYRRTSAGQTLVSTEEVVSLHKRRPGRRRMRATESGD